MARDPKYDILFESVKVGPETARNRFFQTAHCAGPGSQKNDVQAVYRIRIVRRRVRSSTQSSMGIGR